MAHFDFMNRDSSLLYFTVIVFFALVVGCNQKPQLVRLGQYNWVESRLYSDTGVYVVRPPSEHYGTRLISISDNGEGEIRFGYSSPGYAGGADPYNCIIPQWEGASIDLSPCLDNELCYGQICGDTTCIAVWNADTLRITGWGWYPDTLWTGTACNEIHLYTYKEECYEY